MKIEIDEDIFYFVESDSGKWAFDNEKEAIEKLKQIVSENELNEDNSISLLQVNTTDQKWQIKEIPWSKIAMQLMKGGSSGSQD